MLVYEEYNSLLSTEDNDKINKVQIQEKIVKHQHHRAKYEEMQQVLKETECVQISTSDPDSRQMITRNNITEVAYKKKQSF
jgi:tRNA C32,U32 (ribose-2'-O)-methylase TrmJ